MILPRSSSAVARRSDLAADVRTEPDVPTDGRTGPDVATDGRTDADVPRDVAGSGSGGDGRDTSLPATFPVRRRMARLVVLAVVFVCAACGLVYELALVALGGVLVGSSITQTAIVLSVVPVSYTHL